MNITILEGLLGKDATISYTPSGKGVIKFSMATSYKVKEDWKSTWHNVEYWSNGQDDLVHTLKKGTKVHVEGAYENTQYKAKDGSVKYFYFVKAKVVSPMQKNKGQQSTEETFSAADDTFL